MALPCTIRWTPNARGIDGIAETNAAGIPARSISRAIVAPQPLHDPQFATISAPSTRADRSSAAISRPNRSAVSTDVPTPTVAM